MATILVLGGAGFIGRHVAAALAARGERREVHLERLTSPQAWRPVLAGVDTVVNSVGILRERGAETYERVHRLAPGALAAACARPSSAARRRRWETREPCFRAAAPP